MQVYRPAAALHACNEPWNGMVSELKSPGAYTRSNWTLTGLHTDGE